MIPKSPFVRAFVRMYVHRISLHARESNFPSCARNPLVYVQLPIKLGHG